MQLYDIKIWSKSELGAIKTRNVIFPKRTEFWLSIYSISQSENVRAPIIIGHPFKTFDLDDLITE